MRLLGLVIATTALMCAACGKPATAPKMPAFEKLLHSGSDREIETAVIGYFTPGAPASRYSAVLDTADEVRKDSVVFYPRRKESVRGGEFEIEVLIKGNPPVIQGVGINVLAD